MAAKSLPDQDVLLQLLRYEPETGKLFWRERGVEWFPASTRNRSASLCALWNSRYAGKEALAHVNSVSSDGYCVGAVLGRSFKAHRVIWKIMTGEEPDQIDHGNGDRADNRFENLRDVSLTENARNRRTPSRNTSGVIGVHLWDCNGIQYWVAQVGGKKQVYCKTFDEAVAARKAAEVQYGFHPNHGRNQEEPLHG